MATEKSHGEGVEMAAGPKGEGVMFYTSYYRSTGAELVGYDFRRKVLTRKKLPARGGYGGSAIRRSRQQFGISRSGLFEIGLKILKCRRQCLNFVDHVFPPALEQRQAFLSLAETP